MAHRSMPNADAAWLHMDRPTNRMVINSVMWSAETIDLEALRRVLRERLVDLYPELPPAGGRQGPARRRRVAGRPRLRPRPARPPHRAARAGRPDRARGARRRPRVDAARARQAAVGRLPRRRLRQRLGARPADPPLHRRRDRARARDALAHGRRPARRAAPDPGTGAPARNGPLLPVLGPLVKTGWACRAASCTRAPTCSCIRTAWRISPASRRRRARARQAPPVPDRSAVGDPWRSRRVERVSWGEPFHLGEVKAIAKARGATINDVLVSVVAGALGRYLADAGERPEEIHAMVPFNLRPLDKPLAPRARQPLRPRPARPAARDRRSRRAPAGGARADGRDQALAGGRDVLRHPRRDGRDAVAVEGGIIDFFSAKASLVLTNVPGPREPVYVAGARVDGVLVWAPCAGASR